MPSPLKTAENIFTSKRNTEHNFTENLFTEHIFTENMFSIGFNLASASGGRVRGRTYRRSKNPVKIFKNVAPAPISRGGSFFKTHVVDCLPQVLNVFVEPRHCKPSALGSRNILSPDCVEPDVP